ncbi:MAG: type IV secretory system conjugative DNA transfer family protein [Candidatus Thiodiazotropha endolucinida]|nr:type IV secretory system conjugative DNA transfer family protein [Candidatus Thiodiazotropha taylori]MCG8093491.1 type IV secretory system conjugative DNA transfer family protein [Candidatus Thiodiazotropha endolucinida]MCG8045825.1 type IV secretory system conjugative DNA transfer family protein [Candidatus Thiodiazotropha taylori]MCG8049826.1 type IV secretory system conjugative DNA transfer family protein [Candidatus Thiodiazotropha taylori]MCW4311642.1 type IV secretory system conjugativ
MNDFVTDITRDIPRGVPTRYLKQQTVPQARFQDTASLLKSSTLAYDPARPEGKILFGAIGDQLLGIEDNRHIMTVAGSRAGKSVTLISNLLFYQGSILATDPKGELANITAERRAALEQRVCVLDPFHYGSERISKFRASYNPMAVLTLTSSTIIEDAGLIADAMVIQNPNGKDPHWDESAKNFIEGVILHVATDPRYEGRRHLVTVRDLIKIAMMPEPEPEDDDDPMSVLEIEMLQNAERLEQHETTADLANAIEGAARDFYEKSDRERDSVLSTVRRHTKFLDYTAMRKILTGHDFDLRDLKRDPNGVSIYLCFPATRTEICNRWLRLFINQLLNAMEREKTEPKAPVLACLDEFPVLGYMRTLESAAGQIASYHVKLWVILQDWSQGKALYGERWETFTGNAGILQFFGNNDLATTEYISKRLGKTPVETARLGEVGREQQEAGLNGKSSAVELHDLMTAEEISRHFARNDRLKRQLVLWAGYHPMILQRVEYFDDTSPVYKYFREKFTSP